MNKPFLSFLATLFTLLALDWLFYGIILNQFPLVSAYYSRVIDWPAVFVAYILYALGAFLLVVRPQSRSGAGNSFVGGAVYGLIVMGTYALLNDSMSAAWSSSLTFIVLIEAAVVSGAATMAGISVGHKVK